MAYIKGTWIINQKPTSSIEYSISFTSKGETYNSISVTYNDSQDASSIFYDSTQVASIMSNEWYDDAYRTISFGDYDVYVSDEFYEWLTYNAAEEASMVTYLSGVWVLNDEPSIEDVGCDVFFESNGKLYTNISISDVQYGVLYDNDIVYSASWYNSVYKTINFGDIEQAVTYSFYTWLMANATQDMSTEPTPLEIPVSGVWYMKDYVDIPIEDEGMDYSITYSVSFTSNDTAYNSVRLYYSNATVEYYMAYNTDVVFTDSAGSGSNWSAEAYKRINFGVDEQFVSLTFYKWLSANATYKPGLAAPAATFDMSSIQLPSGSHTVTVVAKTVGYAMSPESNEVIYTI